MGRNISMKEGKCFSYIHIFVHTRLWLTIAPIIAYSTIPTAEELEESSDDDSIAAEETEKETGRSRRSRAASKKAQPRRKSTQAAKHTYSLMDGITNRTLKQKRQPPPERAPSRIQPKRGGRHEPSDENEGDPKPVAEPSNKKKRTLDKAKQTTSKPIRVQPIRGQFVTPKEEEGGVKGIPTFESLGNDDVCRIASFSSSIQDLMSFMVTSKQIKSALENDVPDQVYQGLFVKQFGPPVSESNDANCNWTWREHWDKVHDLKKGFRSDCTNTIMETSVGVLRWEKEEVSSQPSRLFSELDNSHLFLF